MGSSESLEIRRGVRGEYGDVLTRPVLDALEVLAPFNGERLELMAERLHRRRSRAENGRRIEFVDPEAVIEGTELTVRQAREGDFEGSEIPADLQRQWIQGTGPGAKPRRVARDEHPQRRLRAAVGRRRLDVRRRGRARPGRHDVARQPAQSEAGDRPRPGLPRRGRAGRRRDERLGRGLSSAARSSTTGGSSSTSRPRSSAPAGCTSTTATSAQADGTGFSASIVDAALYVVNNHARSARDGLARSCSTCRRSRPPRRRRCGTTC